MRLYDAHNHLQDQRLKPFREDLIKQAGTVGVARMVVNGTCEEDWAEVLELAQKQPMVLPSFGYHPWYAKERSPEWQKRLMSYIDRVPCAIGEIGLDRWILDRHKSVSNKEGAQGVTPTPASLEEQKEVFVWQLRLAAERDLPVSIHCLQAWGGLHDILRSEPLPACGFLLHSYGGAVEMVKPLADLGAYFSLPGYFAHDRKQRQQDTFKQIPEERLLMETDAPDQRLPVEQNRFPLMEEHTGKPLNHPANVVAVYAFAAKLLGAPVEALAERLERNFLNLFGGVASGQQDQ